jgi:hypothetical protein
MSEPCNYCRGAKMVQERLFKVSSRGRWLDSTHQYATVFCPQCDGKGYCTQEDSHRYLRSMGVAIVNGKVVI